MYKGVNIVDVEKGAQGGQARQVNDTIRGKKRIKSVLAGPQQSVGGNQTNSGRGRRNTAINL